MYEKLSLILYSRVAATTTLLMPPERYGCAVFNLTFPFASKGETTKTWYYFHGSDENEQGDCRIGR